MVVIEEARESDIPQLCNLLSLLFSQEAEFKPEEKAQKKGLLTIIANPDVGMILVARHGGSILAMVNLLFTVSTALGERVVILEDMIVSPEARGSGVGSMLLSQAIKLMEIKGVRRITLLTDHDNRHAQGFYTKHGFMKSTMIPMRLGLK